MLLADLNGVPNVIPVIDSGEVEDSYVLIMPRAECSLKDWIMQHPGPVPVKRAVAILRDVCTALRLSMDASCTEISSPPTSSSTTADGAWLTSGSLGTPMPQPPPIPARTSSLHLMRLRSGGGTNMRWRPVTSMRSASSATSFSPVSLPFPGPTREDLREQHLHSLCPTPPGPGRLSGLIEECVRKAPEGRPTAATILDRLQSYDDAPMGAGLAQLADANRGVVAGLTRADAERSGAATAAEVRARLVATAASALERISTTLVGQIEGVAWTAQVTRSATGSRVSLGDGELMIRESDLVSDRTHGPHDSPIDIVAASLISVTGRPNAGYKGRSHTLWFCDAVEAGSYAWYETAFMDSAFGQPMIREEIPFALPVGADALGAISVVVSTAQVAWPFTRIDPGDTSEFVERWAGWLAQAAQGTLTRPGRLPERDCRGSWRQQ